MRLISFMVAALLLATGIAHAAPAHDLQEVDRQLSRSDIAGAQATLQRVAIELTGASIPGTDARVVLSAMTASDDTKGYQVGWRAGFAAGRAGRYADHRSASSAFHRGYEAGWTAGGASLY